MTPTKAGKSNKEAAAASRRQLLDAGARLLMEQAQRNPFAALRVRSICESAGYSTGAFYMHWPNLSQYHEALGHFLLAEDEEMFAEDFAQLTALAESSANLSTLEALARLADCDLGVLLKNPLWDAMELLNVTWARTHLRDAAASGYREVDKFTADTYGTVLARAGREARPPHTMVDVAVLLQALVEGIGLRHRVDPSAVLETSDSHPGLYAIGVAALVGVLTRRVGDEHSVSEALHSLVDGPVDES